MSDAGGISFRSAKSIAPPQAEIEKTIRNKREAEAQVENIQAKQAKDKAEEEDRKHAEEIDKLLPETVFTVLHDTMPISFAAFKHMYAPIWEQVADKSHLATGYCDFSTEVLDVPVTIRTFKSGEARTVNGLAPPPATGSGDYGKYIYDESTYRNARVLLSLMSYDGTDLVDLGPSLVKLGAKDWLASEDVTERMEWLDNLSEIVIEAISGLVTDITWAYRLATRENLKNQLAPL